MSNTLLPSMILFGVTLLGCNEPAPTNAPAPNAPAAAPAAAPKPASATPPLDPNNIVSIAINSPDHKTLVAALKAADYVTAVANPGPLTVFAPTDAAFAKLPAGTVENLVKPENVDQLRTILKYHVAPAVFLEDKLVEGFDLGMANGGHAIIHVKDGKKMINEATIIASVRASNGVVHVIDGVLLPPAKK